LFVFSRQEENFLKRQRRLIEFVKTLLRVAGICMALPFFIWVPLGLIPSIPSVIDVFGLAGLKIPTSIAIGGLLMAAIGFEDF
jgi:hypothetical protein